MNDILAQIPEFNDVKQAYINSAECNDALYKRFQAITWRVPLLAEHREHVEQNKLGYGDPAFHTLWASLIAAAHRRFGRFNALEIGVYKGQIISLWALLRKELGWEFDITAISPLKGKVPHKSRLARLLLYACSAMYRSDLKHGNFHGMVDYRRIIETLFDRYGLSFDSVEMFEGLSDGHECQCTFCERQFHVVYVDGDHSYEVARSDFEYFGARVVRGGWLVADDAGYFLPGTNFWKGYEVVSRAAQELQKLGFRNVLNVGHNCVYEKL